MNTPIDRHENIALQFSGGKDSLACVHLLRPHWDRMTLYHVDAGDLLPEIQEVIKVTEKMVPKFVRIETNSAKWMTRVGLPSDLVPTTSTAAGLAIGASEQRIVDRFDCCASNIMAPLHQRMLKDGITLVIRGTKRADLKKLPAVSGPTGMGYDLWLPLQEWSHADVFAYLKEKDVELPRIYQHRVNAPECATCPAWWSEGRAAYLAEHHPNLFRIYREKLQRVRQEVMPLWQQMEGEYGR